MVSAYKQVGFDLRKIVEWSHCLVVVILVYSPVWWPPASSYKMKHQWKKYTKWLLHPTFYKIWHCRRFQLNYKMWYLLNNTIKDFYVYHYQLFGGAAVASASAVWGEVLRLNPIERHVFNYVTFFLCDWQMEPICKHGAACASWRVEFNGELTSRMEMY